MRPAKRRRTSSNMKKVVTIDLAKPQVLTKAQAAQLQDLEDRAADTVDTPEAPAENWQRARRFFKPRKEPISISLDADVLDWLRHKSERYQIEINRIFRKEMDAEISR
jgi:uncharacterized protein (DUF4415 family)